MCLFGNKSSLVRSYSQNTQRLHGVIFYSKAAVVWKTDRSIFFDIYRIFYLWRSNLRTFNTASVKQFWTLDNNDIAVSG